MKIDKEGIGAALTYACALISSMAQKYDIWTRDVVRGMVFDATDFMIFEVHRSNAGPLQACQDAFRYQGKWTDENSTPLLQAWFEPIRWERCANQVVDEIKSKHGKSEVELQEVLGNTNLRTISPHSIIIIVVVVVVVVVVTPVQVEVAPVGY